MTTGYTNDEVLWVSEELERHVGVDPITRAHIRERVGAWLVESRERRSGAIPISGIFAYQMGGGGLIVRASKGWGLVLYAGDTRERTLQMKSVTLGAQLGGTTEFGVGLVIGRSAPWSLGGKYRAAEVGATAGRASTTTTTLTKTRPFTGMDERVILLGAATGFAATASVGKLTLKVGEPPPSPPAAATRAEPVAVPAPAPPPPVTATAPDAQTIGSRPPSDEGRKHHALAVKAFTVGNFDIAISEWTLAYEADDRPEFLYNIFKAYVQRAKVTHDARDFRRARHILSQYLDRQPGADRSELKSLERMIHDLELRDN